MAKAPLISVCLATYNGEHYIQEQLESIISQLPMDAEIIISDDNSADNTLAVIKSIQDDRIRILTGPSMGVSQNFENALNAAKGDIIFLADQDDVWLPGKVEVTSKYLSEYDLVLADFSIVDVRLQLLQKSFFINHHAKPGLLNNLIKNSYVGASMAFDKKVLQKCLPFPDKLPMHDWWIGLVAEATGKVKFIEEPLMLYRRHNTNASSTSGKSQYTLFQQLKMRAVIGKSLVKRIFF